MKSFIPLPTVLVLAMSCSVQNENTGQQPAENIYSDSVMVQIAEYQDRRNTDKLIEMLGSEEAAYREAAALAFASVQDSQAVGSLNRLLKDDNSNVRVAAVYALGQTASDSAEQSLLYALHVDDTVVVTKEVLESLGKCITAENYNELIDFDVQDSLELEGHSWGMYRAGIRGVFNAKTAEVAASYLHPDHTFQTRLGAAHLLSRTRGLDISTQLDTIINSALYDKSPFVRMASASALRSSDNPDAIKALAESIINDSDYRVRISAIRSLGGKSGIKTAVIEKLLDQNNQVAVVAAQVLAPQFDPKDSIDLNDELFPKLNWRVRSILLGGMLSKSTANVELIDKIKALYDSTNNDYEKAALLTALGNSPLNYELLVSETFGAEAKVIATSGIGALASMRQDENFPEEFEQAFADMLKEVILTGDLAMIGTACGLIINEELGFKEAYDSIDFLHEAKTKLTLPKDNEGMQSLQAAIDYLEGNDTPEAVTNEYNHPIDWELVGTIDRDQKMLLKTGRGDITLKLFIDEAPGSVANFVALAESGYYDGKNFHRVVSNFVAQGGCNRGDGWGGEDYSIRSEFASLNYKEGYVGMASAGKDTEGTQWFITHSPTPHLDGRYSIFSRVTSGMDIVHQLEVGDLIESIRLVKN